MIDGLRVDFKSSELETHLRNRERYHSEKAGFYDRQVEALKANGEERANVTNDPVSSLQASARQHRNRLEFFALLANHIVPNETYRIADHDLARLELVSQHL